MFGYVLPDKPELKIKEFEAFRAYYCGVCKAMGRSFGLFSRLTLNYDSVFLGLFLASVHKEKPELAREGCIANPIKRKWVIKGSPSVNFAADINVLLTYYKLKDNWQDERSYAALAASAAINPGYKRAAGRNTEADKKIAAAVQRLALLEKEKCDSLDRAAEPFADMMKQLLVLGYRGEDKNIGRILEWTGYNLGKWIYTIDAFDDIDKDVKTGSYNPLLLQYRYAGEGIGLFKDRISEEIRAGLLQALRQTTESVELLNPDNKGILDNILYNGLFKKTEEILCKDCTRQKRRCQENEKSVRSAGN